MRDVTVWTALQWPSIEHVSVAADGDGWTADGDGWTADSATVAVIDDAPVRLNYRLVVAGDGTTRSLDVADLVSGASLALRSDGRGRWWDGDGGRLPALDNCVDVDIATTPLTNTLPIRRLRLAEGASADIVAVYVSVPALTIAPAVQRYTRSDRATYRYESGSFAADVVVDDDGLVTAYGDLWRRVDAASPD